MSLVMKLIKALSLYKLKCEKRTRLKKDNAIERLCEHNLIISDFTVTFAKNEFA